MNTQPAFRNFTISHAMLWVLLIGGFVLTTMAAFARIMHLGAADVLLPLGLLVQFSVWLILTVDMFSQKLNRKGMWIAGMLLIPWLTMLLYLIKRERLIRMADR